MKINSHYQRQIALVANPRWELVADADSKSFALSSPLFYSAPTYLFYSQRRKKEVKTLSNLTSGVTKQGGVDAQDDTRLQIERSASLPVVNHSVDKLILDVFYSRRLCGDAGVNYNHPVVGDTEKIIQYLKTRRWISGN